METDLSLFARIPPLLSHSAFFIMLSLFSCHDTEAKHEMEEPDFDGFVKISLQSQITGVQPMTGIVLWADNAKRNTDAISLEYSYMQYKDIVKRRV